MLTIVLILIGWVALDVAIVIGLIATKACARRSHERAVRRARLDVEFDERARELLR
jgi:hypothetical protein